MQRKLKSVFRSRKTSQSSEQADDYSDASPPHSPHSDRRGTSLDERRRQSSDSYKTGAQHNGRSRPLSSVYDSHRVGTASGPHTANHDFAHTTSAEPANEAIANDYKAYMPALSPVHDSNEEPNMALGVDKRLMHGGSGARHEEDVADRNTERRRASLDVSKRKPLPATPVLNATSQNHARKRSTGDGALASTIRHVPSATTGNQSVDRDMPTRDGLGETQTARLPSHGNHTKVQSSLDGQNAIQKEIEQLLDGVVDLTNTVDEDKTVEWAPAVVHEVVKPHQHEVIQHRVFREVHNYEYYYHIQPVYNIEVLPPRHWIPNPDGAGLIEISADELPTRTGDNRRWKIIHEEIVPSASTRPVWRTEPEIINHPSVVTNEGFERKETTILYPPTLQDMTGYDGLVQPVHFDHKTGERWLGEITTMHKLRHELGQVADPTMSMQELADNLPEVPEALDGSESSQSSAFKRRPVDGSGSTRSGVRGRHDGIAMAV